MFQFHPAMKTVAAIILFFSAVSAEFPSYVKICKNDAKLNDCIKENILAAKDHLKDGIPSLFAQKYNPIVLSKDYEFHSDNLKINIYKGFVFRGMDDFNIKRLDFNLDKNSFELEWTHKDTMAHGKYALDGKLIKYTVNSTGECNVNTTNFGVILKMEGEREEKEGKTYINFNKIEKKFALNEFKMTIYLENLLPSAEETEAANKFLNENIAAAAKQFKPIVDQLLTGLVAGNIQRVFNAYPIQELFHL